uniref:DUF834 domain-containing protein n=1 Tax=Oryza sativa subsp. japonica TaxID=39947 RepID=Q9AY99_ORYSJ|nr:hypothetical protein [Oryza sativa Japonica Group]
MVAAGDHRRDGAAPERGEGRGKRNGRSTAHPGSTATTETATEAERGGGAARVDEDGGVPAVGGRNEGVDEVGEDAAKPKEAMPKREELLTFLGLVLLRMERQNKLQMARLNRVTKVLQMVLKEIKVTTLKEYREFKVMVLREFKVEVLIKTAIQHSCSSTTSKIRLTMLYTML